MLKTIFFTYILALVSVSVHAQTDTLPPYKKFPVYPPVKLLKADSSGFYTKEDLPKKQPVMLMLFNPDCEHCQHETAELVRHIEKFKGMQIIMITNVGLTAIRSFIEKYNLSAYKNIEVTQDTHYFLISYYNLKSFPFLAFYNKKRALISVFQGSMPIDKVLQELKK